MYCKCGNKIPDVRVEAGYKTCVECSSEEKWGCSQVVYHKTGNTIEVIKDKELCEQINAMGQRPTFGISQGIKGNVKKGRTGRTISQPVIKEKEPIPSFNFIGTHTLNLYENEGLDVAEMYVQKCLKKNWLTRYGANKILRVINVINESNQ